MKALKLQLEEAQAEIEHLKYLFTNTITVAEADAISTPQTDEVRE